ncbi:hypothetical protein [Nostoc sp.]
MKKYKLEVEGIGQMAIKEAWSGIWSDVSVNSAHGLGDVYDGLRLRTLS